MQSGVSEDDNDLDLLVERLSEDAPGLLQAIRRRWLQLERGIRRTYPKQRAPSKVCEVVPRDLASYIRHVVDMALAEDIAVARWLYHQDLYSKMQYPPSKLPAAFRGFTFGDNRGEIVDTALVGDNHPNHPLRSPVLSELTIWQRWAPPLCVPWRPLVRWPCLDEMSWEGDQRVASENGRYGRFPALPRRDDYHDYTPWQEKDYVESWEFDNVWHVPQMDDIYLGPEEVEPEMITRLLNTDLLDAVNCDDIPIPVERIRARVLKGQT